MGVLVYMVGCWVTWWRVLSYMVGMLGYIVECLVIC